MTKLLHQRSDNSSALYLNTLKQVLSEGDELAPRGKKIKEMRPAIIEFLDPADRITKLNNRRINPFFHAAEVIWMVTGRSDVDFLTAFNKNMKNFSDDGVYFNAPYGERLRSWGKHDATMDVYNPLDQLHSVYRLLKADPDTRQAIATIGDPRWDNAEYLLDQGGKDISCNRELYFKIRNGKLDLSVSNRSNDVHWGLFTANLPVFTTFQELVASWVGVPMGVYTQYSDSMHVYLEDYGAKLTDTLLKEYPDDWQPVKHTYDSEPRIKHRDYEESNEMLLRVTEVANDILYGKLVDTFLVTPDVVNIEFRIRFLEEIDEYIDDPYFSNLLKLMLAYRLYTDTSDQGNEESNLHDPDGPRTNRDFAIAETINHMPPSIWKESALTFLLSAKRSSDHLKEALGAYYAECEAEALENDPLTLEKKGLMSRDELIEWRNERKLK